MTTITDRNGNVWQPTGPAVRLVESGWTLHSRTEKKRGVWVHYWLDPNTGEVENQGNALRIEQERRRTSRVIAAEGKA